MHKYILPFIIAVFLFFDGKAQPFEIWSKAELKFSSDKEYLNPIYEVRTFYVKLTSPTGSVMEVDGFWDGATNWKVRFKPEEIGTWSYQSFCQDESNQGLHNVSGEFTVVKSKASHDIYVKGKIIHPKSTYYLTHSDGTPFFWLACTAWNGALRSTDKEWDSYLKHRVANNYNVIQFVATQWRGGPTDSRDATAYTNESGMIEVNPEFFRRMDKKIDKINEYGLVAAPVMLWALPFGEGRHISPGYVLPYEDAELLGRYIKARFGGNHVIWILGGDGKYYDEMESKWKYLGRKIFARKNNLVSLHPHGLSWIGSIYNNEAWLDIIGYQSSHGNGERHVNWLNKGPMIKEWASLSPRPIINMEPNYEEIRFKIKDKDVRNASYWSLFAVPISGITYGANGIWPWLRKGEMIINHGKTAGYSDWETSMKFPGSIQLGYLASFIKQYDWWKLVPANELLVEQPGGEIFNHFISVVRSLDNTTVLVYLPIKHELKLRNLKNKQYKGRWFNPVNNQYSEANLKIEDGLIITEPLTESDWVLELKEE